jgi:hypothetical protein
MDRDQRYGQRRQQIAARYTLSPALITIALDESEVTIHQQLITGSLWCITLSPNGASAGSGGIGDDTHIGWTQVGAYRVIYGLLPPGVMAAEVTSDWQHPVPMYFGQQVFAAVAPLVGSAIVSYKDALGYIVKVQPVVSWQRIPEERLPERLWAWLRGQGWTRPRPSYTYGSNHPLRRKS